jgi:hypothetical protein
MSANYNSIISSGQSSKKPTKTPNKTPLRLVSNSAKKKTPTTLTHDRYIPNRTSSNLEQSYHLLVSGKDQENINNKSINENIQDKFKRKLLNDTTQGAMNDKAKILNLHSKQPEPDQVFADNMKILYNSSFMNNSFKKNLIRHIQTSPDRILDAPELLDDFCKYIFFVNFIF